MKDTVDNMDIGMAVFNNSGNITYKNKALIKMLGSNSADDIRSFMSCLSGSNTDKDNELTSGEFTLNGNILNLDKTTCTNKNGSTISTIATLNDVTEFHELAAAEKKLSIEQERNRIAQEMHDSAGHTFTMISSLSKIASFEMKKESPDIPAVMNSLNEIDGLSLLS